MRTAAVLGAEDAGLLAPARSLQNAFTSNRGRILHNLERQDLAPFLHFGGGHKGVGIHLVLWMLLGKWDQYNLGLTPAQDSQKISEPGSILYVIPRLQ